MPSGGSRSPRGRGAGGMSFSLIVRNFGEARESELRGAFGDFGELSDVYLPKDYYTKEPRNFCFVEFVNRDEGLEAMEKLDGKDLNGCRLRVEEARRKEPKGKGKGFGGGRSDSRKRGGRGDSRRRDNSRGRGRGRDSRRR